MKWNKTMCLGVLLALMLAPLVTWAEDSAASGVTIERVEDSGSFTGLFGRMWSRMRSLSPRLLSSSESRGQTQVAGIRGAETTESLLQTYWKDDLENDVNFIAELDAFGQAQNLADSGDLTGAGQAFDTFLAEHPDSKLEANAQFAAAITYGALGNGAKGRNLLESLMEEHPAHPLAEDAKTLLTQL